MDTSLHAALALTGTTQTDLLYCCYSTTVYRITASSSRATDSKGFLPEGTESVVTKEERKCGTSDRRARVRVGRRSDGSE